MHAHHAPAACIVTPPAFPSQVCNFSSVLRHCARYLRNFCHASLLYSGIVRSHARAIQLAGKPLFFAPLRPYSEGARYSSFPACANAHNVRCANGQNSRAIAGMPRAAWLCGVLRDTPATSRRYARQFCRGMPGARTEGKQTNRAAQYTPCWPLGRMNPRLSFRASLQSPCNTICTAGFLVKFTAFAGQVAGNTAAGLAQLCGCAGRLLPC